MTATSAAVAANVWGVISTPNFDPVLLSHPLVLLASHGNDSGGFGSEVRPLLSTINGGQLPPISRCIWIPNLDVVFAVLLPG